METDGHVIVSAAKAEIMSYEYQPVWQNQQVHSKTSWVSSIDCMQVCSIFIYQVAGDGRMSRVGSSDCLPKFVLKEREFWQKLASIKLLKEALGHLIIAIVEYGTSLFSFQ